MARSISRSPIFDLRPYLHRWGRRLRLAESLTWGPWGAVAGLGVGLSLALAARLWPILMARQLAGLAGLLALVGAVVGLALAWLRPRSLSRLARTFDRRFELAERLATAVEINTGRLQAVPAMAEAQLADTLGAAGRVEPRRLLPLRASRRALLALGVLLVALVLSLWLPNPQEDALLQQAAVEAAVKERIGELEAVKEQVAETKGLTDEERERLLQELEEAIAALEEGRAKPEEALAALAEVEQALAELRDPNAAELQAGLERASEVLADSELTREIAEALAKGDYQEAAEALAELGSGEEELTPEEARELARELKEAAEALAEADPELAEKLAQAAEALEAGEMAEAGEMVEAAAGEMAEAGERVEAQEVIEGALAGLQEGKEEIAEVVGVQQGDQPDQGGVAAQGVGKQDKPGHHEDAGSGDPYDKDYDPERMDDEGKGVDVGREGGEGIPVGSVSVPAPEGGRSGVPYKEVYTEYAEEAGAALEGSYIPLGLKRYVRDYFSSLEP